MKDTWEILNKELAYFGFVLTNGGFCKYKKSNGEVRQISIIDAIILIGEEIVENTKLFSDTWNDLAELIYDNNPDNMSIDDMSAKLFIFSLKDSLKLMQCVPGTEDSRILHMLEYSIERDINSFNRNQIKTVPDYKISLDWIYRLINRLQYIQRLLKFSLLGKNKVLDGNIKLAAGIGGPWSNLDLPVPERVWAWEDEDENFRGEDRKKRKQRRYEKGLENYNNGGSVGDGHYWRELRNEPFSWTDRSSESPYPGRNVLTRY